MDKRPSIVYPCRWEYVVIGPSSKPVREGVIEVVGKADHSLEFSRFSKAGKYIVFHLEVMVRDEAHRDAIYAGLSAHRHIKRVL